MTILDERPVLTVVPDASTSAPQTPAPDADVVATPLIPPHPAPVTQPVEPMLDPTLMFTAGVVDDFEKQRIAMDNRLRQLTTTTPDEDGVMRGFGLDDSHPDVAKFRATVEALKGLEHQAILDLQRAMRRHPLGPWVKATVGVGEKQAARLLAVIGDPSWNTATGAFRTVGQLWAYTGMHVVAAPAPKNIPGDTPASPIDDRRVDSAGEQTVDGHATTDTRSAPAVDTTAAADPDQLPDDAPADLVGVAPRRTRGQKANWSTDAKTRVYLIAQSCIKHAHSPYRAVYDARRNHTALTHPEWTDGHSHADGLRITAKAILRDLYREAMRIHTGNPDYGRAAYVDGVVIAAMSDVSAYIRDRFAVRNAEAPAADELARRELCPRPDKAAYADTAFGRYAAQTHLNRLVQNTGATEATLSTYACRCGWVHVGNKGGRA